ncbi:hypothetical protein [Microbacterium sp. NPDC087665]|uniref:phage holin n=1 Tax=Microbacterium sp. NPDC087665 TaxID=3364194 RepID=UPI00381B89EE
MTKYLTRRERRAALTAKALPPQAVRAWAYRVLVAAGAVVTFYGIMTAQEVVVWLGLAAVVFNATPAAATPVRPPEAR